MYTQCGTLFVEIVSITKQESLSFIFVYWFVEDDNIDFRFYIRVYTYIDFCVFVE